MKNAISELESLGIPLSSQKFIFDCTTRTLQKFKASSDEADMKNLVFSKAEILVHSLASEKEREILSPLLTSHPYLLLCLSGLLSIGAQFGRKETAPQNQDRAALDLPEYILKVKQHVLESGFEDVLDVLSSELGADRDESEAVAEGLIARFDRLAVENTDSNPWLEMDGFSGNMFARMKSMETLCLPHYSEILRDIRMPVYESLCDVLRGPAGKKLYEILCPLHGKDV